MKSKRFLAMILAVACTLSLFAGCASETAEVGTRLNGVTVIEQPQDEKEPAQEQTPAADNAEEGEKAPVAETEQKPQTETKPQGVIAENTAAEPKDEEPKTEGIVIGDDGKTETPAVKDDQGNLLVPFDTIYPEAFAAGEFEYEKGHALLKLEKGTTGVSKELRKCGFIGLEKFVTTDEGDWYKAKVSSATDVVTAVNKAREVESVIIADYDYISKTEAAEAETVSDKVLQNAQVGNQWYLKAGGVQSAWKYLDKNGSQAGGSSSVVVAVIDTGVDYNHPDLAANMWVNTGEIPDNGIDDDGNGYVDDIHGVDVIAGSGNPMDDHAHGTHVAGIIAAVNNKEGIVGVAYNAKIMAVKAGQATGIFNQSDIAEAILYAHDMGADVINMSFGGAACSIAVQDALQTAYTRCTLVASAGNDGKPNQETDFYPYPNYKPNYPAALSYVIGVMSVGPTNVESSFTNWDAYPFNAVEYEVYAPGESMLSTLPGGKYGELSGTSMAAPMVSAAAALLRSYYTDRDMYPSKFISAQLSATSEETAICVDPEKHTVDGYPHNIPMVLDVYAALTKLPKPEIYLHNYYLFDSKDLSEANNGDGVIDAGETVNIGAVLRNRWGMSKDTVITVDALSSGGIANPYVEIIDNTANFASVGTYSTKDMLVYDSNRIITGTDEPLVIKIAEDCPNDYLIQLYVTITYKNGLDEDDNVIYSSYRAPVEFWVRNGKVLPSQITEDMTLTKDKTYIVANGVYIAEGVTVTVEPGTKIQFWTDDPKDPYADTYISYIMVAGNLICEGTLEEPIEMYPCDSMGNYRVEIKKSYGGSANPYIKLQYTDITNPYLDSIDFTDHCIFRQIYEEPLAYKESSNGTIRTYYGGAQFSVSKCTNSAFYKVGANCGFYISGNFDTCAFSDCVIYNQNGNVPYLTNCVFIGNSYKDVSGEYSSSSIRLPSPTITLPQYMEVNEKTNTCYYYHAYASHDYIDEFAKTLGGHIVYVETIEEYKYLFDLQNYWSTGFMKVDLPVGSRVWPNGEKVNEEFTFEENLVRTDYYGISSYSFTANYDGNGFVCEIPITAENSDVEWDIKNIENIYLEAIGMKEGWNNESFNGNVILNRILDPDTSHWLQITCNTGYDPKRTIGVAGNYWGTTDETIIEKQIYDFDDNHEYKDIVVGQYLTTAPEKTFPFVTDVYLLNAEGERVDTVSNEEVAFVVEFNRDMDTTVPLRVRFGASEPYAEYEVEGSYENPRKWVGIYTLNTTIENGNQYFTIENGRAADDHFLALYDTPQRFTFEIDTTAAQALIMSGTATETGIQLNWTQDDFETLIGYNVYRSDKEDGYYQRLNSTVIPYDTKEFFDSTVEPGQIYYYNFTVVKTDLTESEPSGKTMLRSMDTMAPDIYHSPVYTAFTGSNLIIGATITDNLQIASATVYYRTAGASEWKQTAMSANNSRYTAVIGAENLDLAGLEYYIDAFDGVSHTYKGSPEAPYAVTVKLAVDKNSLGDVNGDGVITIKDALMVLQAANDKLNLSAEEFLRADLDEDGELSAAEALKILKYANGSITSLMG